MAYPLISNKNLVSQCHLLISDRPKTLFPFNLSSSPNYASSHFNLNLNFRVSRVSSEDIPTGLTEDSKFVPLNSEDQSYGPPALLLLGFQLEEAAKIQQFLKELDGEFLEVIFCTEDMINRSLWEAVNTKQSNVDASKVAKSLPRICFLSGLTGEEMMMLIDAFPESGLQPAVFAALVPNSADKHLAELIEEIMGDHEMLSAKQTS
ncbi:septation ring formation regulator EzrA [Striga asiatica]|uniref:Septation ring formation regulator EzrA n=1 Tax=Striga asiatica TaxID=4170 RepID=A0A5A7R1P4_STRAF|nr:septation ring formation regulator EzrA [Striga asiatica]